MRKMRRNYKWMFILILFLCLFLKGRDCAYAEEEEQRVTVWYTALGNSGGRYFQNICYETNEASSGGTWYGQYWNGKEWVTYTSGNTFGAGKHNYEMNVRVTDIQGAKPGLTYSGKNTYISGSSYSCNVQGISNEAEFHFRLFAKWNSGGSYELFDSMESRGFSTVKVKDQVVGYYYKIDNSAVQGSLSSTLGAAFQTGSGIPYDVRDMGKYLHVRAKAYSGALSDELVIKLGSDVDVPIVAKLTVSCGTGIAKVTAYGEVSGTSITAEPGKDASGSFYPGETVVIRESTKENGTFLGWSVNRGVRFLEGTGAGDRTAKFQMPNAFLTKVTAQGKEYYRVTVRAVEGIAEVSVNGQKSTDGELSAVCYVGDSYTLQASSKEYYKKPDWVSSGDSRTETEGFTAVMGTGDVIYTVSAKKERYTVKYEGLQGATPGKIDGFTEDGGTTQKVTETVPVQQGFTFQGYRCTSGPEEMLLKLYQPGETYVLKSDLVFTAQWTADSYTIRLHSAKPEMAGCEVEHTQELLTGEGIELKDATAEQIKASKIGNFGIVTSTYYSKKVYRDTATNQCWKMENVYFLGEPQKSYTPDWVYYESGGADTLNIVYDTTTQEYYLLGKNDRFMMSLGGSSLQSGVAGADRRVIKGGGYQFYFSADGEPHPETGETHVRYYAQGSVNLGSSYKIYTDVEELVELKDATAEQIKKYSGIPGFATMTSYTCDEVTFKDMYPGTQLGSGTTGDYYLSGNTGSLGSGRFPYRFFDRYSYANGIATNTLKWIYTEESWAENGVPTFLASLEYINSSKVTSMVGYEGYYYTFPEGTVFYDNTTKGYYMYTRSVYGVHSVLLNKHTGPGWTYLGSSYKIAVPNTWEWQSDGAGKEGYFTKTFTKFTDNDLPQVTDTQSGAYELLGWHAAQWKNQQGDTYAAGEALAGITVTDAAAKTIDLYADWEPNAYTVRYIGNGGTGEQGSVVSVTYHYDTEYAYPQSFFLRDGYTFSGWYDNSAQLGYVRKSGEIFKNLSNRDGAVIIKYAGWSSGDMTYNIRFHANGATEKTKLEDMTGLHWKDKVSLPDTAGYYVYDGYEFAGWCLEKTTYEDWETEEIPSALYQAGQEVSGLAVQKNQTVDMYAVWKKAQKQTYTVHFDGNGADSGKMDDQTVFCGESCALNRNLYGKTDYAFTGWNTRADGTGISYADGAMADFSAASGSKITLYAQWDSQVYLVKYDGNGADEGIMDDSVFAYDMDEILSTCAYRKTGYHTDKKKTWNTKADGSGTSYEDEAVVKNLAAKESGSRIIYAQWLPNTYTIHYDGNGADSGRMERQTKTYGSSLQMVKSTFEKNGYIFLGWSLEADGSGGLYPDAYLIEEDLTEEDGADITFYAQWLSKSYLLTINPNGGTWEGSTEKQQFRFACDKEREISNPERPGYVFTKWVLSGQGSMSKSIFTMGAGNAELTAQWRAAWVDVYFDYQKPELAQSDIVNGETKKKTVVYLGTYGELPQPEIQGWKFEGWYTDTTYQTKVTKESTVNTYEKHTLYAKWLDVEPPQIKDEDGNKISEDEVTIGWTKEDVRLYYKAVDFGSGLKEMALRDESGNLVREGSSSLSKNVTQEGISNFILSAYDNMENRSDLKIHVKIDKTSPSISGEESYVYPETGVLPVTFQAVDSISGLKSFQLYSCDSTGEASLVLLKEEENPGNSAVLAYEFRDDYVSDSMYFLLKAEDLAGNVATKLIRFDAATSITGKAWKSDMTTVTDDTLVLPYIQYGDMNTWFEVCLNGYLNEVVYDFDDDLNALGVADVTHSLNPAESATDTLQIELPTSMVYDHIYTVTIRGRRQGREVSMKLYLKYVEYTLKPRVKFRYMNGMAMPEDGSEWHDYDKEAAESAEKVRKYREGLMQLPENMKKEK